MKVLSQIHAGPRGGAITPECSLANEKAEETTMVQGYHSTRGRRRRGLTGSALVLSAIYLLPLQEIKSHKQKVTVQKNRVEQLSNS